jgi:hypothetical protein
MTDFSLRRLVQNAILLRLGLAFVIHFFASEELFAPDQTAYHHWAAWLANYWSGDTLIYPPRLLQSGPTGYYYVVASLYSVFGAFPLVPKLANAALGGLSVLLVHDVAQRITGSATTAARAARYTAFFPSLILWSALNIRDVWVILLILVICREALVLQERFSIRSLIMITGAVLAVTQFRDYIFFAVAGPMVVSVLVRNRRNLGRNVVLGMLLAAVVIYGDQVAGSQRRLRSVDLEELQAVRHWNAVGAKSSFAAADISTPGKALAFLPIGLTYFLLAPFPWSITGLRQVLTLPEMLFFYSLLPSIVRGIRVLIREHLPQALMMLLITGGLTLGYALGEGNAGTAYRHRAQVIGFYLIFAATGMEAKRRAESAPELVVQPSASA